MALQEYRRKRDFRITSEPSGAGTKKAKARGERRFVIQKHDASRLHFDFRLQLGRSLVSWAVPKGLPWKHGEKHLAVHVEDHPLSYFDFEGTIPEGEYGGGTVQVWDKGTWTPQSRSPAKELAGGKLHFTLHGEKSSGEWYLVQLHGGKDWLIIRGGEDHAKLTKEQETTSVLSGRSLKEIAAAARTKSAPRSGSDPSDPSDPPDKKRKPRKRNAKPSAAHAGQEAPAALSPEDVKFLEPMKARLVESAPEDGGEWSYEVKFDGFRALAYKLGKAVLLLSRTNHDLSAKFPETAAAILGLKAESAVLDGEIVALDPEGRSSFQLLQAYELGQEKPPLFYYAFDLLELEGKNLRGLPLEERKEKLESLLPRKTAEGLRFSASLEGKAETLLKMAAKHGLEGLIGKRKASLYETGRRSGAWIKLKIVKEQEFVIGGHTEPEGSRAHFGALLLGVRENGALRCVGKVGTGFSAAMLSSLHREMRGLSRKTCPFENLPEQSAGRYGSGITAAVMQRCHWLQPKLVAQVKFSEWTRDGRLRQPVFLGLRRDKDPESVIREVPA